MPFKNFNIWRGRLPHWRADDVRYYVTFRHRRDLSLAECQLLLANLLKAEGKQMDVFIACVLPGESHLIFEVKEVKDDRPIELSKVIEMAKNRVSKQILKKTEEKWGLFYSESYDRIIRDDAEFEERWMEILELPVAHELVADAEDYLGLWVRDFPST